MNILVLVHNFWKMLMICFLGFFASYLSIVYQHLLSVLCRLGVVIDGLVVNEVRIFVCVCGYGFFSFYVLYGVQMSLNPGLDVWSMRSVDGLKSLMVIKCCLNVAMGDIGI